MDISDQKAALRKQAYALRKTAFRQGYDFDANARLLAEIGAVKGAVISGYMPIRTELSPLAAMTKLSEDNRICVPVIEAKAAPLKFRKWRPDCDMEEGAFGAMIPKTGDWLIPDIMIVPLLGFDTTCNRLGYGGGFYDRTLAGFSAPERPRAIGFAFDVQEMDGLVTEPTDQTLDAIVTESRTLRPLADRGLTA